MKVFLVSFDVCFTIVTCEKVEDVFSYLKEKNPNFHMKYGKIYHKWTSEYDEECQVEELSSKTGIVFEGAFG